MKKVVSIFLAALVFAMSFAACSNGNEKSSETEVVIFAAASMTESLEEIAALYKEEHPDIKLTFNFDSSGTLKTQIQQGANCDIFISASNKQMDQLDSGAPETSNTEKLDFVLQGSRVNLLQNKVVLAVPEKNSANITDFKTLEEALKNKKIIMAMGNADVPVGQYTQKILQYYKLDETKLAKEGKFSYGSNVKEVTTQVKQGAVDCGVIYCTDAYSANLKIVDYATKEMCGEIIYPAALIKKEGEQKAAKEFLDYLQKDKAVAIFEKAGFSKA